MSSMFSGQAEQRQFGKNGVDVIDEFCEASIFDEAARYLTKTKLKLSNDQKLTFYALFKQATVGPCNTPKPSILSMYERTKWNAWNDLGKMSKDEAITRYVNELEKVAPSWHEESGVIESVEDDEDDSGKGGNGADGAMVMPQSRPVHEDEVAESDLSASEKHIWHYAGTGNIDAVKEWIRKKGANVNEKDAEGRTPLHWAVDRAHVDLVRTLLTEFDAEVNEKDADGSTPLHYAALCDHAEIVKLLIMNGANPWIEDGDGETSEEAIRGMKDITPEIIQIMESSEAKSKTE